MTTKTTATLTAYTTTASKQEATQTTLTYAHAESVAPYVSPSATLRQRAAAACTRLANDALVPVLTPSTRNAVGDALFHLDALLGEERQLMVLLEQVVMDLENYAEELESYAEDARRQPDPAWLKACGEENAELSPGVTTWGCHAAHYVAEWCIRVAQTPTPPKPPKGGGKRGRKPKAVQETKPAPKPEQLPKLAFRQECSKCHRDTTSSGLVELETGDWVCDWCEAEFNRAMELVQQKLPQQLAAERRHEQLVKETEAALAKPKTETAPKPETKQEKQSGSVPQREYRYAKVRDLAKRDPALLQECWELHLSDRVEIRGVFGMDLPELVERVCDLRNMYAQEKRLSTLQESVKERDEKQERAKLIAEQHRAKLEQQAQKDAEKRVLVSTLDNQGGEEPLERKALQLKQRAEAAGLTGKELNRLWNGARYAFAFPHASNNAKRLGLASLEKLARRVAELEQQQRRKHTQDLFIGLGRLNLDAVDQLTSK